MKPFFREPFIFLILTFSFLISHLSARAQVQEAWAVKYNNGVTNGQHQALKMAWGTDGNIYVCGFSQNANSNLDYAVLKCAPNGNLIWVSRFDSTNTSQAKPAAFALDVSNDAIVTGNALTVKYDASGNQLWTAPYAGTTIAADSNANIYVGGFSQNFGVEKLSPAGSNIWLTTYVEPYGQTISQSVLIDSLNNVYVSGLDTYYYVPPGGPDYGPYVILTTIKYDADGRQLWKASEAPTAQNAIVQVEGSALDASNELYIVADFFSAYNDPSSSFDTYKYASNGMLLWSAFPDNGSGPARGLALDTRANAVSVGQDAYAYSGFYSYYWSIYYLNGQGSNLWTQNYPNPPFGSGAANSVAVDSANNIYVTGYSPDANGTNDIVTIAYDTNGKQLWLQRYTGVANYGAVGNAIAVDKSGNVYAAGYENVSGGGTEMILIKYAPVTLQQQSNGNFLLQAQGAAGEPFDIQASTNLQSWSDLGLQDANTNGLLQYLDTNTALYPYRFYLAIPEP